MDKWIRTHLASKTALGLYLLLSAVPVLQAQTRQLLTWRNDLAYLETIPKEGLKSQGEAVSQIRNGIEFWLKLHPGTGIELKSAPPHPWDAGQVAEQIAQLRGAIDEIIKEDPKRPFDLGVTLVSVTAEASPLSPLTDSINHAQIENLHLTSVTQAIQYIPGLAVDRKAARNQSGVMIRGFDTRQVGLYLDNVPIYVPYDGYADVSRFLTGDIAEIEVAKGYSSPLLGPGGLGGAVNLVSRKPEKKFEGDAIIGTGSGGMLESGAHIGSRWGRFFFRGGMDWLQTNYYPVSGDFKLNANQPDYERANSYQRDVRYNGRIGWTPRGRDQYVFTYSNQKADYASPPYSGTDPSNRVRYWQWPVWNRNSYYFNSNTGLGESGDVKLRIFYDHYPNRMHQFSDPAYSILSGVTTYDDRSDGASVEFATRILAKHTIGASFFFKDDTHRERAISFSNGVGTMQPWRTHRDQTASMGFHDAISLSPRLRATIGISMDHINARTALDLKTTTTTTGSGKNKVTTTTYSIAEFECDASRAGAPPSACLLDVWAFNPLASLSYSSSPSGSVFLTFARKSHFPTMKDRYSYKNGQAIPNPAIQPEHARNWNLGYSHVFSFNAMMQVTLFRSDVYDAIENAILAAEFPNQCPQMPAGVCQRSLNVGKAVHQGAEFTIRTGLLSRLTVDANYTFLDRTISGPENMPAVFPTGTPKHRATGTAGLRLPRQIKLLASARYDSGAFTTNDSGIPVPASKFAVADLGGIVPIVSGMRLQVGVKNLFDRNYYFQEGYPEPGRNVYLNLRYRF